MTPTPTTLRETTAKLAVVEHLWVAELVQEFDTAADAWGADITDGHLKDERITALELALRLSEKRLEAAESCKSAQYEEIMLLDKRLDSAESALKMGLYDVALAALKEKPNG